MGSDTDCSPGTQGYHKITLFTDAKEFCWMPECKVIDDTTMGCFMYKMADGDNRAYVTVENKASAVGKETDNKKDKKKKTKKEKAEKQEPMQSQAEEESEKKENKMKKKKEKAE